MTKKIKRKEIREEINIPDGINVQINGERIKISRGNEILEKITSYPVSVKEGKIIIEDKKPTKNQKKLIKTTASHIRNMFEGVNKAFEKKLIVEGIGFKSDVKGKELHMALGFSHPVVLNIPEGLKVIAEKNIITVTGIDKENVGQFVAKVRSMKKPEPYKGKGIRYSDEVIRRKQGKKSV